MKKVYYFYTNYYGGFKASEHTSKEFTCLLDCFQAWKKSKAHDFSYCDGTYHRTEDIGHYWEAVTPYNKHGFVYGKQPPADSWRYDFRLKRPRSVYFKKSEPIIEFEVEDIFSDSEFEFVFDISEEPFLI